MTLLHKIKKAFRPRTYTNFLLKPARLARARWEARAAERRAREIQRRRESLTVEGILQAQGVDRRALEDIRARLADVEDDPKVFWTKYLDYEKWLGLNIRYVQELGLVERPPRDVLDLGCGGGFFLLVCRQLGARVMGLDMDKDHVFNEMIALFKLDRVAWRIRRSARLPDFERRFDLITAWMVCFNLPLNRPAWGVPEWDFFLTDVASRLKPHGTVILSLNKQLDNGELYSDELRQFFESRGARIEGKRLTFTQEGLASTAGRRREGELHRV